MSMPIYIVPQPTTAMSMSINRSHKLQYNEDQKGVCIIQKTKEKVDRFHNTIDHEENTDVVSQGNRCDDVTTNSAEVTLSKYVYFVLLNVATITKLAHTPVFQRNLLIAPETEQEKQNIELQS